MSRCVRELFCVLIGLAAGFGVGCGGAPAPSDDVLRVALWREPQSWNRLLAADLATQIVTDQLHAPLIRLNQKTQQMEPALAESWSFARDGTELTFHLRQNVQFSDGEPFTAEDVSFTFQALYDAELASPDAQTAHIDGEPFEITVVDESTVCFRLARRTASVERIFDSIRILPKHRYEKSLERGTLREDTGLSAAPEDVVGLGPFRLRRYEPGQRIVLERNPHYWRSRHRELYPKLSSLVFDIVPDESTRLLRLRAGEVDVVERLSPDGFDALEGSRPENVVLSDLGPGMVSERLWFNLNPESTIEPYKKTWFRDVRFRRAVAMAVDRSSLARVVFGGRASPALGPVSPANHFWRNPEVELPAHDVKSARELLSEAGFRWDATDSLHDASERAVELTLSTNSGDPLRLRTASFLQEDLRQLGIDVNVAAIDGGTLLSRVTGSFDYEACLLGITQTDPDPSAERPLWLSKAPLHLWHPRQAKPATEWEARIDELMERVTATLDEKRRKEHYGEVQEILAKRLPLIDLVVPHALLAYSVRVHGVRATPFGHVLWNSDELHVDASRSKSTSSRRDGSH